MTANFTFPAITSARGTVLAAVKNDLQVELVPMLFGKSLFQVGLGLLDVFSGRKTPPLRQPVNMSIDRKGRDTERLSHHNTSGFVSNTG